MTASIPALTVWQPWASLIALGFKPYEFRGWPAPERLVGRRIAIHAGARPVRRAEIVDLILRLRGPDAWSCGLTSEALAWLESVTAAPASLWRSAVVCTAVLGVPAPATRIAAQFGAPVNDSDRTGHANWAWPMLNVESLTPPVPATGAQGFWRWSPP